ncbi:hypothetical protein JCM17845_01490 [Iodidimonas gelatinilytica]|uniref:carbamoyl-phosphate synthase (glutamine-hydrolyzing) n=1 Tax=Iodidimonas gelatinilytica TaxID=1236966 RepID=A0A5A7MXD6_9PROT|nr:hypothetical protein JCM17845_01490 [Iodidimonas gelatinilytica]
MRDTDKDAIVPVARELLSLGFDLIATRGTAGFLAEHGIEVRIVNKVAEGRPHIVDLLKDGEIDLMFNTTSSGQSIADSYEIRRSALIMGTPYYTTMAGARAAVKALGTGKRGTLEVAPLQSYAMRSG